MGEKCIQHNPASEHPTDTPDFSKMTIGNLAQRLKEITDNPELAPEQKRTAFWENFNTLTDYPPGLDNRFYWLMDVQKLLIGANSLEKLLESSTDQVDPEHPTPEVLRNRAALAFEQYRASFDGIAPNTPNNPRLPSSRRLERIWRALSDSASFYVCITPALLQLTDNPNPSKTQQQTLSPLQDIKAIFDRANQQTNTEQKIELLLDTNEHIADMLAYSKTTLFTAFLRLLAAQVTHDLAELGYYGKKEENIRQRAVAIEELSELIASLENDERYNAEDPDKVQDLYKLARYFKSLYSKEQEALKNTQPTNPADHLGAVAVSDTTTLQHAA